MFYNNDNNNGLGSLHLSSVLKTLVNPLEATKSIVAQVKRSASTVLNPIMAIKKTAAELKRAKPMITAVAKTLINPIATAKIALNPLAQTKSIMAEVVKPKTAPVQEQAAAQTIYQDANGNVISKEEYDRQVAEASTTSQPIYQDANGNVISKEEYDAAMAAPQQTVYQDEKGNVITKEQYDAAMAAPQTVYQDEKGNVITKEQYDAAMAQYYQTSSASSSVTPVQTQQATVVSSSGSAPSWGSGGDYAASEVQSAPVDISSDDVLEQQVKAALLAIKDKAASGKALTDNEKDFVDFMAKATIQVGPMSGFGFYPIWEKNRQSFPWLPIEDTEERLFSEPNAVEKEVPNMQPSSDSELPSFNSREAGAFSPKENFEGLGEWCKL